MINKLQQLEWESFTVETKWTIVVLDSISLRTEISFLGENKPLFSSRNLDFGSTVAPSFLFGK